MRAVLTRKSLPFHKNMAEDPRINAPMAPIVLKILAVPTAAVHAGIANTNIVAKVLRTTVTPVRASPMMSVTWSVVFYHGLQTHHYRRLAYKSRQCFEAVLSRSYRFHKQRQLDTSPIHSAMHSRTCHDLVVDRLYQRHAYHQAPASWKGTKGRKIQNLISGSYTPPRTCQLCSQQHDHDLPFRLAILTAAQSLRGPHSSDPSVDPMTGLG